MNPGYRKRLEQYISTMIQAKSLLVSGNISASDYTKIDTMIAEKYGLSSCNIYRGIDLIYKDNRGNMSHNKEVR